MSVPFICGPGAGYRVQPSGQCWPVAVGPFNILHLRRSNDAMCGPPDNPVHSTPLRSTSMPRGVKPVMRFGGLYGGSNTSVLQVSGGLLPSSRRPIRPGTPAFAYQIDPSVGFTMIPYANPLTRMSLVGSGFS